MIKLTEDQVRTGLAILKQGNWNAALDHVLHGDTLTKVMTGEEIAINVAKIVAIAVPGAANAVLALEVAHAFTPLAIEGFIALGVRPIDYGDANWNAPAGPGNVSTP